MQKTLRPHLEMFIRVEFQLVTFAAQLARRDFWLEKMRIRTMSIIPWCRMLCNVSSCIYIETHSMMHQSEFDAANVALSRAADKRKSLINIHKNWYTATLRLSKTLSFASFTTCSLWSRELSYYR